MRVTVDNREPWPHPWAKFLPENWELVREKLETGDVVLSALPEGAVIECKTPSDMASCLGQAANASKGTGCLRSFGLPNFLMRSEGLTAAYHRQDLTPHYRMDLPGFFEHYFVGDFASRSRS